MYLKMTKYSFTFKYKYLNTSFFCHSVNLYQAYIFFKFFIQMIDCK